MSGHKASVQVGSNIAFIKYWGVLDEQLNIPQNNSISMTLADAYTKTTLAWDSTGSQVEDEFLLDGRQANRNALERLVRHLDRLREIAGIDWRARVVSENNFPMASGIASSASGFAALTVAGCNALDLGFDDARLSRIARLGSGSASRSLFGGFVEWAQGSDDESSVAFPLFPENHWPLRDIVAVVSSGEKRVSSENGHKIAATSPLNAGRVASLSNALAEVREAIEKRDIDQLGRVSEQDTLAMHAVMMTGTPSLNYWEPATMELMHAVRDWREQDGLPIFFTIDAGPNVHIICEEVTAADVVQKLESISSVQRIIASRPGPGPQRLDTHLF